MQTSSASSSESYETTETSGSTYSNTYQTYSLSNRTTGTNYYGSRVISTLYVEQQMAKQGWGSASTQWLYLNAAGQSDIDNEKAKANIAACNQATANAIYAFSTSIRYTSNEVYYTKNSLIPNGYTSSTNIPAKNANNTYVGYGIRYTDYPAQSWGTTTVYSASASNCNVGNQVNTYYVSVTKDYRGYRYVNTTSQYYTPVSRTVARTSNSTVYYTSTQTLTSTITNTFTTSSSASTSTSFV